MDNENDYELWIMIMIMIVDNDKREGGGASRRLSGMGRKGLQTSGGERDPRPSLRPQQSAPLDIANSMGGV